MSLFDLPYADTPEQIDDVSQPEEAVTRSMADLVTVNRYFGGTDSILAPLLRMIRNVEEGGIVRILDIGAGSADIPRAIVGALGSRGIKSEIVAVDINPTMLRMAAQNKLDEVSLIRADALALPFANGSFDIAVCSMTLHHLGLESSSILLRGLHRLTTRGFIATDLLRDRLTLAIVMTGLHLMRAQPMTLHDADASVRRAFTLREAEKIVALSGAGDVRIDSTWYYRLRIVQEKPA